MKKLLYAINHRQTEDMISEYLSGEYLPVGAATYKEAIIEQLHSTGADVVLIRDSLPGSTSLESLLKRIRVECPDVRVVLICSHRQKKDPFLQEVVGLAIYDIINSDRPAVAEIASYVKTPRTFRDAAQYGIGLPEAPIKASYNPPPAPSSNPHQQQDENAMVKKTKGFLSDVAKGFAALKKAPSVSDSATPPAVPTQRAESHTPTSSSGGGGAQVNLELLRESIKESEARKAQADLDRLVKEAVDKQTAALLSKVENLQKQLERAELDTAVAEKHASSTIEELNALRTERDGLNITLTDTRREMQQAIDMYESQLRALHDPTNTPEWYSQQTALWDSQKNSLTKGLEDKTREVEELTAKCNFLTEQIEKLNGIITTQKEQIQRAKDMQLSEADSDELIGQLRAEISEVKSESAQLNADLERTRKELEIAQEGGADFSVPLEEVPQLPDDTVYKTSAESPKSILFLGAKHGIGTTTAAMNLAAGLAGRGFKTILVEFNQNYPMCNQFFEFTHIPFGIEEAAKAVASGEMAAVDKSIIRPHGLRPTKGSLYKTYKKLPAGLHFMLFSNQSLVNRSYEKNPLITEATLYTLLSYLSKRQQYSHIIVDVQCDDFRTQESLLQSGYQFDKLCLVLTQDPHAVASAGVQITNLSKAHASSMIAGGEFIINKFAPNAPITQKKIEQILRIRPAQITKLSEDTNGFLTAAGAGIPYLLNSGHHWMEYDVLRAKVCPDT